MTYSPEVLVLTLSRQCNIACDHCIVEGQPREKERLGTEVIDHVVSQAKQNKIETVCVYGGEPLLRQKDLLPYVLHCLFREGFPVMLGTNGFWGRTNEQAKKVLTDLEEITSKYNGYLSIGLSVDRFHQPHIPAQSIANIITTHRRGNYHHIHLGIISFRDQESFDIVGQVHEGCQRNGIYLFETNEGLYAYPALKEELIEYDERHLADIRKKLNLPEDTEQEDILTTIASLLRIQKDFIKLVNPKIIARHFDMGEGEKDLVVFPDVKFLIELIVEERVINAGRARKDHELEMHLDHGGVKDYLVIGSDGLAYEYPAELTTKNGVFVGKRPLCDVIEELKGKKI